MKNMNWLRILVVVALIVAGIVVFYQLNKSDKKTESVQKESVVITSGSAGEEFNDGLHDPISVHTFNPDEFGAGVVEVATFSYDINEDGRPDKISRARQETGTAHFRYVYKVELNDGEKMVNITPKDLATIEGAECAMQKIQFSFKPDFSIIKISRPLGDDWDTPTQSTKTVYALWNNKLHVATTSEYKTVCDVAELF